MNRITAAACKVNLYNLAERYNCVKLAECVLERPRFDEWSASSHPDRHHYGKYGLITHTDEVVRIALSTNQILKPVNEQHLFLACLFHDVGKIWEYNPDWEPAMFKGTIGHIVGGSAYFGDCAKSVDFDRDAIVQICHAILAHHGRREWGSPVEPQTPLAMLVHQADMMSARMYDLGKGK